MTFSYLRSFLIVDDQRRSFPKRDRSSVLVLVCYSMKPHPRFSGLARLELKRDGNFARSLERIRPEGHSRATGPYLEERPLSPVAAPPAILRIPRQRNSGRSRRAAEGLQHRFGSLRSTGDVRSHDPSPCADRGSAPA